MNITFNICYKSSDGNARKFAEEMINSKLVEEIRAKKVILDMTTFTL